MVGGPNDDYLFLDRRRDTILLILLAKVGFSKKTIIHEAEVPFGPRRKELVSRYPAYQWIARISLVIIFIAAESGLWLFFKNQQKIEDKVIVLVSQFDGPEEIYGIHRQVMEDLQKAIKGYDDIIVLDGDKLITSGNSARELGRKEKAALVIWAWYRPTYNPNITLHIENLSAAEITVLKIARVTNHRRHLGNLSPLKFKNNLDLRQLR